MADSLLPTGVGEVMSARLDWRYTPLKLGRELLTTNGCDLKVILDQQASQENGQQKSHAGAAFDDFLVCWHSSEDKEPVYVHKSRNLSFALARGGCSSYTFRTGATWRNRRSLSLLTGPRLHDIHIKFEGPHLGDLPEDFHARLQAFLTDILHMPALHVAVEQGCVHLLVTLLEISRGAALLGTSATRLRRRWLARPSSLDPTQLPMRLLTFMHGVLPEGAAPQRVTVCHNGNSYELDASAVHTNESARRRTEAAPAGAEAGPGVHEEARPKSQLAPPHVPPHDACRAEACSSVSGALRTHLAVPHGVPVSGPAGVGAHVGRVTAAARSSTLLGCHSHVTHESLSVTWGSSIVNRRQVAGKAPTQMGYPGVLDSNPRGVSSASNAAAAAAAASSAGGSLYRHAVAAAAAGGVGSGDSGIPPAFIDVIISGAGADGGSGSGSGGQCSRVPVCSIEVPSALNMQPGLGRRAHGNSGHGGDHNSSQGGINGDTYGLGAIDLGWIECGTATRCVGGVPYMQTLQPLGPPSSYGFPQPALPAQGHVGSADAATSSATAVAGVNVASPAAATGIMPDANRLHGSVLQRQQLGLYGEPSCSPQRQDLQLRTRPSVSTAATSMGPEPLPSLRPSLSSTTPDPDRCSRSVHDAGLFLGEANGMAVFPGNSVAHIRAIAAVTPIDPRDLNSRLLDGVAASSTAWDEDLEVCNAPTGMTEASRLLNSSQRQHGMFAMAATSAAGIAHRRQHQHQPSRTALSHAAAPSRRDAATAPIGSITAGVAALPPAAGHLEMRGAAFGGGAASVGGGSGGSIEVRTALAAAAAAETRQSTVIAAASTSGSVESPGRGFAVLPTSPQQDLYGDAADSAANSPLGGRRPHNVVNVVPSGRAPGTDTRGTRTAASGDATTAGAVAVSSSTASGGAATVSTASFQQQFVNRCASAEAPPASAGGGSSGRAFARVTPPLVAGQGASNVVTLGSTTVHSPSQQAASGTAAGPTDHHTQHSAHNKALPQPQLYPSNPLRPANVRTGNRQGHQRATSGSNLSNRSGNQSSILSWGVDALEALMRPPMPPAQFTSAGSAATAGHARPPAVQLLGPAVVIWPSTMSMAAAAARMLPAAAAAAAAAAEAAGNGVSLNMHCPDVIAWSGVPRGRSRGAIRDMVTGDECGGRRGSNSDSCTNSVLEGAGDGAGAQQALGAVHVSQLVAWSRGGTIPVEQSDDSLEKRTRVTLLLPQQPLHPAPSNTTGGGPEPDGDAGATAAAVPAATAAALTSAPGSFHSTVIRLVNVAWRRGRALGPVCPVLLLPPGMEDVAAELIALAPPSPPQQPSPTAAAPSLVASYQTFLSDFGLWLEAVQILAAASAGPASFQRSSLALVSTHSQGASVPVSYSSAGATPATSYTTDVPAIAAAVSAGGYGGGGGGSPAAAIVKTATDSPTGESQVADMRSAKSSAPPPAEVASPFCTAAIPDIQHPLHPAVPSASAVPSPSHSPTASCPNVILNTSAGASSCSTDSCERLARIAEEVLNLGCDLLSFTVARGAVAAARLLLNMLVTHGSCIQALPALAASSPLASMTGSVVSAIAAVPNKGTNSIGAAVTATATAAGVSPGRMRLPASDTDAGFQPLAQQQPQPQQRRPALLFAILEACRTGNNACHTLLHLAILSRSLPMLQLVAVEWPQELGLPPSELNRVDRFGRAPADYLTLGIRGRGGRSIGVAAAAAAAAELLRGLGPPSAAPAEPLSPPAGDLWGLHQLRRTAGGSEDAPWRASASAAARTSPPRATQGLGGGAALVGIAEEASSPSLRLLRALSQGGARSPLRGARGSGGSSGFEVDTNANSPRYGGMAAVGSGDGGAAAAAAGGGAGSAGSEEVRHAGLDMDRQEEGDGLGGATLLASGGQAAVMLYGSNNNNDSNDSAVSTLQSGRLSGMFVAESWDGTATVTTTQGSLQRHMDVERPLAAAAPGVMVVAAGDDWERRLQRRPLNAALLLLLGSVQALVSIVSAMPHARALPPSASLLDLPAALTWLPSLPLVLAALVAAAAELLLPPRLLAAAPWLPAAVTSVGRAVAGVLTMAAAEHLPYGPVAGAADADFRAEAGAVGAMGGAGMPAMMAAEGLPEEAGGGGGFAVCVGAAARFALMTLAPVALETIQPSLRMVLLASEYGMPVLYLFLYGKGTAGVIAWLPCMAACVISGAALAALLPTWARSRTSGNS
ncbi:hypothetical protein Agub_g10199 [Astrephomene gubernaculifera]|uniref:Uncharacterized protein n=1 Tax=Astrephomene gubernaculifera TaxID=47775 RepID=A0AAD3DWB2_9CHLO|nr:hypothetical protein Agub_g10199 [Astrephomene gubernaculifera]